MPDSISLVKHEVLVLLSNNFGNQIAKTFQDFYVDEPTNEYMKNAFEIFADFLGKEKARTLLNTVLRRNNMEEVL